ncbi:hypothetical protein ACQKPY_22715, partial [Pseudomonas fluorescens]
GSELARDGDGSVNIDVGGAAVIASKLAPTLGWWCLIARQLRSSQTMWERACSRWRWVSQY